MIHSQFETFGTLIYELKIIPAKNPNRRGFSSFLSSFLFVLMSVSGGVHGDFLKPFRKSSALCGVSFKSLM